MYRSPLILSLSKEGAALSTCLSNHGRTYDAASGKIKGHNTNSAALNRHFPPIKWPSKAVDPHHYGGISNSWLGPTPIKRRSNQFWPRLPPHGHGPHYEQPEGEDVEAGVHLAGSDQTKFRPRSTRPSDPDYRRRRRRNYFLDKT